MDGALSVLVCRARGLLTALPLGDVVETMRPLPIDPIANMPEIVVGLSVVRGEPVPVVDLGAVMVGAAAPRHTRFVAIRVGRARVVLAVEEVLGVRPLDATSLRELPALLEPSAAHLVAAIGRLDRDLLLVLDAVRVVSEPLWERLAKAGVSR